MGDPRIARGAPISAADAIAAFNRQRASGPDDFGERANAYRQRWGFEQQAGSREAQSALSNAPQARLHEGGWQDRRAYGDGAKQPADGIWPPPAEPGDDAASEEVEGTPSEHADDEPSRTTPSKRGDEDDLSRTAKYMARRMDAYNASIAAKGPRAFPRRVPTRADGSNKPAFGNPLATARMYTRAGTRTARSTATAATATCGYRST